MIDPPVLISPVMSMISRMSQWIGLILALGFSNPAWGEERVESAGDWIKRAAMVSRELALKGEIPPPVKEGPAIGYIPGEESDSHGLNENQPMKSPLESHVSRYLETRPWLMDYGKQPLLDRFRKDTVKWPVPADADALRSLLKDADPGVRGMAAESLAILLRPEDAPALADLLDDSAESAPILSRHPSFSGTLPFIIGTTATPPPDTFDRWHIWRRRTVADYAGKGLKLLTGREFPNKDAFQKWWQRNSDARSCLWYWQLRLQRTMDEVETRAKLITDTAEREKQLISARTHVARVILDELRQLPPEVEAKVRLLTTNSHAGGAPITGSEGQFWPEPPTLRLKADRLLELLDRRNLWTDVDWDAAHYNLLAERLGLWAEVFFKPRHAGRLRAALERERNQLWWSGQTALIIGISRLHPAAKARNPAEAGTRDRILRDAAAHEPHRFVRGYCAAELVRVGLPANAAFLHRIAFVPTKVSGFPDVMQSILEALAHPPLSESKRRLLADIVLDDRFKDSWTRPFRSIGDDMNRNYAIWAINAQAGRIVITPEQASALADPQRSAAELDKVRADIKSVFGKP